MSGIFISGGLEVVVYVYKGDSVSEEYLELLAMFLTPFFSLGIG